MNVTQRYRYIYKPLVFLAAIAPLVWLTCGAFGWFGASLGADPVKKLEHECGKTALQLLLLTLAVTPVKNLLGFPQILRLRRMLGLFAFFYVVVHFTIYLVLDLELNWSTLGTDIAKRPYITIGFTALLLMIPLAATSTNGMMRRLGRRWTQLHRLVYVIAILGVWHFYWQVKRDVREPLIYAGILALLLLYRLLRARAAARAAASARAHLTPTSGSSNAMPRQLLQTLLATLPLLAATLIQNPPAAAGQTPAALPAPADDNTRQQGRLQTAVLAGGCFWGMQEVFEHVRGVHQVLAGYSGGPRAKANYQDVETGSTGHAESVQITFDPAQLTYGELLQIYFSVAHDPTELDRQGPDTGKQYRSVIFYADDTQQRIAANYIRQLTGGQAFAQPIVTAVDPLKGFYRAEDYHQDYYLKNPQLPYIVYVDLPKVRNLKSLFPAYYSDSPATVGAR